MNTTGYEHARRIEAKIVVGSIGRACQFRYDDPVLVRTAGRDRGDLRSLASSPDGFAVVADGIGRGSAAGPAS